MANMVMGCTALQGLNKAGVLKPDADGYFTVVLGALDFKNSVGQVYTQASARKMFEQSSSFMRRLRNGYCRGEYGHPKRGSMSNDEFLLRIMTIEEKSVCMHISEVWIDTANIRYRGENIVAIMGKIKPCGPYGEVLREQLLNGKENVAFSIRSITDNYYSAGIVHKDFVEICCWDYVTEPGLAPANKYSAPGMEAREINTSEVVTMDAIDRALALASESSRFGYSLESGEMLENVKRVAQIKATASKSKLPASAMWR